MDGVGLCFLGQRNEPLTILTRGLLPAPRWAGHKGRTPSNVVGEEVYKIYICNCLSATPFITRSTISLSIYSLRYADGLDATKTLYVSLRPTPLNKPGDDKLGFFYNYTKEY